MTFSEENIPPGLHKKQVRSFLMKGGVPVMEMRVGDLGDPSRKNPINLKGIQLKCF